MSNDAQPQLSSCAVSALAAAPDQFLWFLLFLSKDEIGQHSARFTHLFCELILQIAHGACGLRAGERELRLRRGWTALWRMAASGSGQIWRK